MATEVSLIPHIDERLIARGKRTYEYSPTLFDAANPDLASAPQCGPSRSGVHHVEDRWHDLWYYNDASERWLRLNARTWAQLTGSVHTELDLLRYYGPLTELIIGSANLATDDVSTGSPR